MLLLLPQEESSSHSSPASLVGSLPQKAVLHNPYEFFPEATVLHGLVQRRSLGWDAVLQEHTPPAWSSQSYKSCQETFYSMGSSPQEAKVPA